VLVDIDNAIVPLPKLKKAVRLYLQDRAKPEGGMSLRQVQDEIIKYSMTVHYSSICRYANEGLIASPKKMGPPGMIPKANYKLLCAALFRACLQNFKVQLSIGDGSNNQQATAFLIQEDNHMACAALTMMGYNGDMTKLTLKPAASTRVVTITHSQDWIELPSQAKTHSIIYAATGGII
jgi:hypothetical protein